MAQVTLVLGPEYDDRLRDALRAVLISLGAGMLDHQWGVGGSQEVEILELELDGERLVVESETYIGLSIIGPSNLVQKVLHPLIKRVDWIPLLPFGKQNQALAISSTGAWLVGDAKDHLELSDPRVGVRLLALLEADPTTTLETLVALSPGAEVPLMRAVIAGLESRSDYWAAHALRWLAGLASTDALFRALDDVSVAEWAPQRLRHAATRALLDRKQCRNQDSS